jgi:hypothetical protein
VETATGTPRDPAATGARSPLAAGPTARLARIAAEQAAGLADAVALVDAGLPARGWSVEVALLPGGFAREALVCCAVVLRNAEGAAVCERAVWLAPGSVALGPSTSLKALGERVVRETAHHFARALSRA